MSRPPERHSKQNRFAGTPDSDTARRAPSGPTQSQLANRLWKESNPHPWPKGATPSCPDCHRRLEWDTNRGLWVCSSRGCFTWTPAELAEIHELRAE